MKNFFDLKLQLAPLFPILHPVLKQTFPDCLWTGKLQVPKIALTFDDGPHPKYTLELLKVLDEFQISASFFWLGEWVECYPEIAKEVYQRGHWIGLHGYQHLSFTQLTDLQLKESLEKTQAAIYKTCQLEPKNVIDVRPPNGFFTPKTLELLKTWGYRPVMWTVVPEDWVHPGVDVVVNRVLQQTINGSIIVLHDGYFGGKDVVQSTRKIIPKLLDKGYQFVTISELWSEFHLML